ncbi:helix-turn-helix transcriptional regulator [Thalassoglobus polymorphus]|uniref:HTH domain protein n=1 Tax=Thalassoglobus polymorphus TaxID=2527994 RepID=A0A517QGN4_9PLAN|nr:WYL domain-containing protein [Thalassoglobus polymorphus]QDT30792.1 HTH domain protein [Thalassoglobus polymorphus]
MSSIGKIRRLLNLMERLQSGRIYNTKELADFCNVSRRTIFRDIKTLQDSGIPVLYDASKTGYWISSGTYLPPTDFTLAETLSLMLLAQEMGSSKRGVPFQGVSRDAALKLQSNLPNHLRQYVGELTASVKINTEPQADLDGSQQHYERALEALTSRKKIRLRYNSLYDRKVIRTLVSPYRLLFQRRAWYIIGRSSMHRAVRTFHVGRIQDSEITDDEFTPPPRFTLQRYLGNAWNLVRERGARSDVVVRFQPLVAQNVAEVSWHKTQRLVWNPDGTMDFHVTVDGIHEISWWIMGYADQAEVLQPSSLVDLITTRVQRMAKIYKA